MTFEQQLEDLFTRVFSRAIKNALQQLPFNVVDTNTTTDAVPPATEEKPKRTRKPKTEEPIVGGEVFDSPRLDPTVIVDPATAAAIEKIGEPPAAVPPATGVTQGIPTGVVERRNVSAALITVAKNQELGPAKAYEVLSRYGAKEVGNLKEGDYRNVVLDCAKLLGIEPQAVLQLDPTKN